METPLLIQTFRDRRAVDIESLSVETKFHAFVKEFWKYIDPAPFNDTWVIGAICEHLQAVVDAQIMRLLINIHFRSAKTTLAGILFPAWIWQRMPEEQILYLSHTARRAYSASEHSRDLIVGPYYQKAFGDKFQLTKNTATLLETNKGGSRTTLSVESAVTGEGGNLNIFDDPNDVEEVESPVKREAMNSRFDNLGTRANDFAKVRWIVAQQRTHPKDVSGHIEELGLEFEKLIIPLEYQGKKYVTSLGWSDPRTEVGEISDKVRFRPQDITELKLRLGYRYQGQANQNPKLQEGGAVKRVWYKDKPFLDFGQVVRCTLRYDIGYSSSPNADWTWGSWKVRLKDDTRVTLWQHFGRWDNDERNTNMKDFGLIVQRAMKELMPNVPWSIGVEGGVGPGYDLNKKCRDELIKAGLPAEIAYARENKVVRANSYLTATEAGFTYLYSGEQLANYGLSNGTAKWQTPFLDIVTSLMFDNAPDGTPRWKNEHDDPLDAEADADNELTDVQRDWTTYEV